MSEPVKLLVWVAYYDDLSDIAVFEDELSCLRYAISTSMEVGEYEMGRGIREQIRERWEKRKAEHEAKRRDASN